MKSEETRKKSTLWEYAESIIIALVLGLVIPPLVVQAFKIPSESMEPTLEIGDHLQCLDHPWLFILNLPSSIR